MTLLLDILDWIFIFVLGLPVLYLFVFAAASTRARKDTYPPARLQRRFVTLIPAYKSDAVIVHAARTARGGRHRRPAATGHARRVAPDADPRAGSLLREQLQG